MIILSLCQSCLQQYEILVEASDFPLLKEISDENGYTCPCPRLCGGSINLIGNGFADIMISKQLRPPIHLSCKDLYKAVKGLGLPDEIILEKLTIEPLFSSIESVDIEEHNGRLYIHELKLKNGLIIHLAAGLRGAQILKITKGVNNGSDINS